MSCQSQIFVFLNLWTCYLVLLAVICHALQVAHQELQGVVVVIWEVVDLEGERKRLTNQFQ